MEFGFDAVDLDGARVNVLTIVIVSLIESKI